MRFYSDHEKQEMLNSYFQIQLCTQCMQSGVRYGNSSSWRYDWTKHYNSD